VSLRALTATLGDPRAPPVSVRRGISYTKTPYAGCDPLRASPSSTCSPAAIPLSHQLREPYRLLAAGIFAVLSVGGLAITGLVLVRLPADYFSEAAIRCFWGHRHALIRAAGLILENLLGALVVAFGVVLSLPAAPGPGLLTIVLGMMLLDFPGKRCFERWLVSRPAIFGLINRVRRRYGKPPFHLEPHGCSPSADLSPVGGQDRGSHR
jgi:hypothetical protein